MLFGLNPCNFLLVSESSKSEPAYWEVEGTRLQYNGGRCDVREAAIILANQVRLLQLALFLSFMILLFRLMCIEPILFLHERVSHIVFTFEKVACTCTTFRF